MPSARILGRLAGTVVVGAVISNQHSKHVLWLLDRSTHSRIGIILLLCIFAECLVAPLDWLDALLWHKQVTVQL